MVFAVDTPKYNYDETQKRTGANYVKFSTDYRVVLRILDTTPKVVWKHFIRQAQKGKGTGVVCPSSFSGDDTCPIERSLIGLPKDDEKVKENRARKKFIVNVLDRTPYTVCEACGENTPGKKCQSCKADLKKAVFAPLNKVKILEHGPRLFLETLNGVDDLQQNEFGLGITDYDITFSAQGEGRDRKISAIPQAASELSEDDLLDPETGEPQKLFDLDVLAEPTPVDDIEMYLNGATMAEVLASHGIE